MNGVDVAPLIEAELDRRMPERATMRPTDPDGFREAWDILERLLRRDRMATMRTLLEGLTEESLAADTVAVDAPGWPRPQTYPVRRCLLCILNEEWEHRLYAERDLAVLSARPPSAGPR